jgi:hypothetical protein
MISCQEREKELDVQVAGLKSQIKELDGKFGNLPLILSGGKTASSPRMSPITLAMTALKSSNSTTFQTLKRDHSLLPTRINAHCPPIIVFRYYAYSLPGGNGQFIREGRYECAFDDRVG